MKKKNLDPKTVASFGDEWSRFDQSGMSESETRKAFEEYFAIFPWAALNPGAEGFDMGCGSGRWARFVAPRVGCLNCVDPSSAIDVARTKLAEFDNVEFHQASVDSSGLLPGTQDFGYSLGVLHHVPDTNAAIRSCVELLKPGAPLLLYLYYAFDNRPAWFRALWRLSDIGRRLIYRLRPSMKHAVTDVIAALVYWPLARLSGLLELFQIPTHSIPLSYYRKHTFYTMRTDARDRFGTPLEQRFTRAEITSMMRGAGLVNIRFSEKAPYWCVLGNKV
ncbi:MAG: class I SAM-dependent methyltransferase [Fluviibacter sp.]